MSDNDRETRALLRKAVIAGVYTTAQGNFPERTTEDLLFEAIQGAVHDAGLDLGDIDGIAGGRSPTGSNATAYAAYWSELLGNRMHFATTVDAAAAGHCAHILHAALAVAAGLVNTVVVIGGGTRGGSREESVQNMAFAHGEWDASWGTLVPSWFALIARRHMHEYGTTSAQLAEIAVSTRRWAAMHPQAIMKKPIGIEDVLNSRLISEPLHLLDCCLVNDGAGALVITSAERARSLKRKPVYVLGGAEEYTWRGYVDTGHDWLKSGATYTGPRAMAMAGVTHRDIDVLELYDCFTITVLRELEDLGFCAPGEGGSFVEGQRLGPGGDLPTNTFGGGLSWGHRFSGLAHAIEAVQQLRGDAGPRQVKDAEVALVHAQGGPLANHSTVVLSTAAS